MLTSIVFYFPAIIYVLLWIIIKPEGNPQTKNKSLNQFLGIIIGGIAGFFSGYAFGLWSNNGDPSGGIVVGIFAIFGIPVGMLFGFGLSRYLTEKKNKNECLQ